MRGGIKACSLIATAFCARRDDSHRRMTYLQLKVLGSDPTASTENRHPLWGDRITRRYSATVSMSDCPSTGFQPTLLADPLWVGADLRGNLVYRIRVKTWRFRSHAPELAVVSRVGCSLTCGQQLCPRV